MHAPLLRLESVDGAQSPPVLLSLEPAQPEEGAREADLLPLRLTLANRSFIAQNLTRPLYLTLRDRDGDVARAVQPEEAVDALVVTGKTNRKATDILAHTFRGPVPPGETRWGIIYVRCVRATMPTIGGLVLDVRLLDDTGEDRLLQARIPVP